MFVRAIETADKFTRPIHSIVRYYGSTAIHPGAATLFFVNADGWALTCKHVAQQIIGVKQLHQNRTAYTNELTSRRGKEKEKRILRELAQKYGYSNTTPFELYNRFMNCIEGPLDAEIKVHPNVDLALIHFRNYTRLLCNSFPDFAANGAELKPGKFLCRLGFPFPEFSNYTYNDTTEQAEWTETGRKDTPRFRIEGMVTRLLASETAQVIGFEMSTPGLKGQSGGPAFDSEGVVWGMQSATNHLDLDFDVNQEVLRQGAKKRVHDSAFLHVGNCVHIDVLKSFMRDHGVEFRET